MKLLFIFIICSCSAFSQINYPSDDFIRYQRNIDKAELYLIKENWDRAAEFYAKAIESQQYIPNIDDLHNAMLVSSKLNDHKKLTLYINIFKKLGYCDSYFEQLNLDFINADYKPLPPHKFRIYLDSIFEVDQLFRREKSYQEILKIDSVHLALFIQKVGEYGFPMDLKLGVICDSLTHLEKTNLNTVNILFNHFHSHKEFQQVLDHGLMTQSINPYYYLIYQTNDKFRDFLQLEPIYIINDEYYTWKTNYFQKRKVNRIRKKYGLCSINEQIKIIDYVLKNKKTNKFRFNAKVRIYTLPIDSNSSSFTKFRKIKL